MLDVFGTFHGLRIQFFGWRTGQFTGITTYQNPHGVVAGWIAVGLEQADLWGRECLA